MERNLDRCWLIAGRTQRLTPASEGFEGFVWIAIPSKGLELASRSSKKWLMPARSHGRALYSPHKLGWVLQPRSFDFVSGKQTLKRKENYTIKTNGRYFFGRSLYPLLEQMGVK
jgi:hypothetical protein